MEQQVPRARRAERPSVRKGRNSRRRSSSSAKSACSADPERQACVLRQRPGARYDLGAAFVFQLELKDGGGTDAAGGGCIQVVAHTVGGRPPGAAAAWNCVEMEQSIPCFLVSVTLECSDKWKRE